MSNRKPRAPLRWLVPLALLHVLGARDAGADQPLPPPRPGARELGDHVFIPSNIVSDPFPATWFHSQTAFGYLKATRLTVDENGMPTGGKQTVSLTPFQLGFGLQVGVFRDVLALRATAHGSVIPPVDLGGALLFGAQAGYGFTAGLTASGRIGRRVRLGGTFDVGYGHDIELNIFEAIGRSIEAGTVNASTLLLTRKTTRFLVAASVAVALHRSLGFVATVGYGHNLHSVSDQDDTNDGVVSMAATLDFDLRAITPVPIGIAASYRLSVPAVDSVRVVDRGDVTHQFAGGVYYTGRKNLLLGPEVQTLRPPASANLDLLFVYGVLTLRYYW